MPLFQINSRVHFVPGSIPIPALACSATTVIGLPSGHSYAMVFSPARHPVASARRHIQGYWCNMRAIKSEFKYGI